MRTAQVSIHVKLFGGKQLSEEYIQEHGNVADVHSYVDSNTFSEALLAAVADVTAEVEKISACYLGRRRDLVSSANPDDAALAKRLEPSRPVDIRDLAAICSHLKEQDGMTAGSDGQDD